MADEKKIENEQAEETQDVNLDDLEQVTGGSIRNVKYTKTKEISSDTKSKI